MADATVFPGNWKTTKVKSVSLRGSIIPTIFKNDIQEERLYYTTINNAIRDGQFSSRSMLPLIPMLKHAHRCVFGDT